MAAKKRRRKKRRYHSGEYLSEKTGRTHKYRSSYELRYMQCLDRDPAIVDWDYESIKIRHRQNVVLSDELASIPENVKARSYTPDFILTTAGNARRTMIEVKPKNRVMMKSTQRKKRLAEQYCAMYKIDYKIITLEDIIAYERYLGHDAEAE